MKTFLLTLTIVAISTSRNKETERRHETASPPAQNNPPAENSYLANRKAEAQKLMPKFDVKHAPASLPKTGTNYDWRESLAFALHYAGQEPLTYDRKHYLSFRNFSSFDEAEKARRGYRDWHLSLVAAYGLLQLGNSPVSPMDMKRSVTEAFLDPKKREQAFAWALPSMKIAFRAMPRRTKIEYLAILRHASVYLASLSESREDAYLASLKDSGCRAGGWRKQYYKLPKGFAEARPSDNYFTCDRLFIQYDANGTVDPFRKWETFLYRRIKEGWPREAMKESADRVIAELQPLV